MVKNSTWFSCSVSQTGYDLTASIDGRPVFIGCANTRDAADACIYLAEKLLEMAHLHEHSRDFCAPEYDKQEKEKQLEKLREAMED